MVTSGAARAIRRPKRRSKGLVGEWIRQEYDTSNVPDLSGNGNHGTITSATWVAGRRSPLRALSFDGSGDSVNCRNGASLQITSNTTIEGWFKTSANGDIIKKYNGTGNQRRFAVYITGGVMSFRISADGAAVKNINGSATVTDGIFRHFAAVYDSSYLYLYINGVSDKAPVAHTTGIFNSNQNLIFGQANVVGDFNGVLGLVRIYNRALSAREVLDNYNNSRRRFV